MAMTMATITATPRQQRPAPHRAFRATCLAVGLVATLCIGGSHSQESTAAAAAETERTTPDIITDTVAIDTDPATEDDDEDEEEIIDYGNHNLEWEDGPASEEEFGHDNDPSVCGVQYLTVEEWEAGKYWTKNKPVIVTNVTDGWAALKNWRKQEMLRLYPDAEATMGEGRLVGETGPDEAGKNLQATTVKEYITKHMYNPLKYFFDRKIAIPKGMLEDCHPFPMPTRAFLENPHKGETYAPSYKKKVRKTPLREIWRDHLAISIGSDLHGLTWHNHREAWNTVIFGSKRWLLWDHARWKGNNTMQFLMTRDWINDQHVTGSEWIRKLYNAPARQKEIRDYGHDCIQRAGEMMFVPERWMHMVVNIGDTISVISEVGLGGGEGKKPEDFLYDPNESSEDEEEEWSSEDNGPPPEYYRQGGPGGERGPPPGYYWSSDDEEEWSSDDEEPVYVARGGRRGPGPRGGPPPQFYWGEESSED